MKKLIIMKLIDLYKEWMETGRLPKDGLCHSLPRKYRKYLNQFKGYEAGTFWAYPLNYNQQIKFRYETMASRFTPLRQTIVLLICAMCDEL